MRTRLTSLMPSLTRFWQRLSPGSAFLVIAALFGVIFCFKTPPFQVPDEVVHFYRAYEISEGHLLARQIPGGYGDLLPANMTQQVDNLVGNIRWNPNGKYNAAETFQNLSEHLDSKRVAPVHFEATAAYSPVAYVPQSIGVGSGRLLDLPLVADLFLGRLANLAVWIGLVVLALWLIPFGKWALFALALTPMSLFQAASVSPDAMINGSAFVFVAVSLRLIFVETSISKWEYMALFAPVAVFALSKPEYLPLALLLLPIPALRFGSVVRKRVLIATVVVVAVLLTALWNYKVRNVGNIAISQASATLHYEISPKSQFRFILKHPIRYGTAVLNTYVTSNGDPLEEQFIGVLGWLDTKIPLWIVILDVLLIAYCLASIRIPRGPTLGQRGVVLTAGLLSFLGVTTALYAYYTPVGYWEVIGLQGRYFIPLSPLLIPLTSNLSKSVRPTEGSLKTTAISVATAVLICSICVLSFRYYNQL